MIDKMTVCPILTYSFNAPLFTNLLLLYPTLQNYANTDSGYPVHSE